MLASIWRRTRCLAPIWAPCLLASSLASHLVPGTDSGPLFASIDLALHPVPGTDSGTCLLASTWRCMRCVAPIWAPGTWCLAPIWAPYGSFSTTICIAESLSRRAVRLNELCHRLSPPNSDRSELLTGPIANHHSLSTALITKPRLDATNSPPLLDSEGSSQAHTRVPVRRPRKSKGIDAIRRKRALESGFSQIRCVWRNSNEKGLFAKIAKGP